MKRLKPSRPSSVFVPRLRAATTPIQAPISVASSVPVPTSSSVQGSAPLISSQTDSRERWLVPRSSLSVSPT